MDRRMKSWALLSVLAGVAFSTPISAQAAWCGTIYGCGQTGKHFVQSHTDGPREYPHTDCRDLLDEPFGHPPCTVTDGDVDAAVYETALGLAADGDIAALVRLAPKLGTYLRHDKTREMVHLYSCSGDMVVAAFSVTLPTQLAAGIARSDAVWAVGPQLEQ